MREDTMIRITLLVAVISASLLPSALKAGDEVEPCTAEYLGATLSADVLDVALTVGELSLLNGQENPKLKKLMQRRLVTAASAGRRHIRLGAKFPKGIVSMPNMVDGLDRAIAYVAEQELDKADFSALTDLPGEHKSVPSQDLQAIRTWIRSLPSPTD
jgi:hypothetical protein